MSSINVSFTTPSSCPNCDGRIKEDPKRGETACLECGTIICEEEVDHGPEWRAFDAQERNQKSRAGAPTTQMMHDKGLSTTISWQNKDAKGNQLTVEKRKQVNRLRKWHTRCQTKGGKERNLKQALREINRMASALGLPYSVRETASVIYRRSSAEKLINGRSIEGVTSAALYAACRQESIPRIFEEIETVSRVDRREIVRTYQTLNAELGLSIGPANPTDYLPRFASEVSCSDEARQHARGLLDTIAGTPYMSGKNPAGLAAAALYAGAYLANDRVTQQEVSEVAGVTTMTIRERYPDLLEMNNNE